MGATAPWKVCSPGRPTSRVSSGGGRCPECKTTITFPGQGGCPGCVAQPIEERLLARRGRLWAWTTQDFPPPTPPFAGGAGRDLEPFGIGYVKLPEERGSTVRRAPPASASSARDARAARRRPSSMVEDP